jgi:hypothetical protein
MARHMPSVGNLLSPVPVPQNVASILQRSPGPTGFRGIEEMLKAFTVRARGKVARWCAYGLALAAPGSLIVLPLWLLRRHWRSRAAWTACPPRTARVKDEGGGMKNATR